MEGIHDMGGVEGYGRAPFAPGEKAEVGTRWEAVAGAATFALLRSGLTNIDAHRHRIERLDPSRYFPISYWGRWLAAVESAVIDQGIAEPGEIEAEISRKGDQPADSAEPPRMHPVVGLESRHSEPGFIRSIETAPRFSVGDQVMTQTYPPHAGHHRLPNYCRGRHGVIARVYPAFTFPDTMAHGGGESATYVYAVAFNATELWGPDADPSQRCHLDLFEPYLRSSTTS